MSSTTDQKTIMQFYAAFVASILCNFVPMAIVQGFGLCLFLAVMIAAYIYKARSPLDSLLYNHMTYLIGTIWIGSFLLLIGMAIATYWVYNKGDHTLIMSFMDSVNSGVVPTPDQMEGVMMQYIQVNKALLITATLSTIGPGMLYIIYRTVYAMTRASKGYRLAKPAGWL